MISRFSSRNFSAVWNDFDACGPIEQTIAFFSPFSSLVVVVVVVSTIPNIPKMFIHANYSYTKTCLFQIDFDDNKKLLNEWIDGRLLLFSPVLTMNYANSSFSIKAKKKNRRHQHNGNTLIKWLLLLSLNCFIVFLFSLCGSPDQISTNKRILSHKNGIFLNSDKHICTHTHTHTHGNQLYSCHLSCAFFTSVDKIIKKNSFIPP